MSLSRTPIRTIVIVADYGWRHDLAFLEVRSALRTQFPNVEHIECVGLPPFDTEANDEALLRWADAAKAGTVFLHNVAPRKDDVSVRAANRGEEFVAGVLPGRDVLIVGANSGRSLSSLKDRGVRFHQLPLRQEGSQFRSRDYIPQLTQQVATGRIILTNLPEVPDDAIPSLSIPAQRRELAGVTTPDPAPADRLRVELVAGVSAMDESARALKRSLGDAVINVTAVPDGNTLSAGFVLAQASLGAAPVPDGTLLVSAVEDEASDAPFFIARVPGRDSFIVSRHNGFAWSSLKGSVDIRILRDAHDLESAVEAATHLLGNEREQRGQLVRLDEAPTNDIPDLPAGRIAYIDGYGNIKQTTTRYDPQPGDDVRITLNGVTVPGAISGGSFEVPEGSLAVSSGSAGWLVATPNGLEARKAGELFLRGGSAAAQFDLSPLAYSSALEIEVRVNGRILEPHPLVPPADRVLEPSGRGLGRVLG